MLDDFVEKEQKTDEKNLNVHIMEAEGPKRRDWNDEELLMQFRRNVSCMEK